MEWRDLISNDDLDMSIKIVTRKTSLQMRLDAKLVERLKWRDKKVKIQVSLAADKKRVRIVPAATGWPLLDKKAKGTEISVRQLLPATPCTRKCSAAIEGDALIISLPDDFELKNARMVVTA